jgi:demethylmenaquinone methyltransferase/2-methoxy-6-polyprenyl-1,4-benzoquinol methylase
MVEPFNGDDENTSGRTHFGFADVARGDKAGMVRSVFDSVAPRYDLMNDLMSAGVHRLWKDALIDWLCPRCNMHLLDVAGGTGDIAFRFLKAGGGRVSVCDINERMVSGGRDRALDRGLVDGIDWCVGDAEALPLPARALDAYTIAFGLRNVTDPAAALTEAYRVLKPGGRFLCLEFSHVVLPWLADLYDRYSFSVLPWIGQAVAQDRDAYRYLVESIRRFPEQPALAAMMTEAGFARATWRNMSGGIVAMHSGWRL